MTIEVDREDLETLIHSIVPYNTVFDNPLVRKAGLNGRYYSGPGNWSNLENLTNEELYELYTICKQSWKTI